MERAHHLPFGTRSGRDGEHRAAGPAGQAPLPFATGRLRSVHARGDCSELHLDDGDRFLLPAVADAPAARRVLRGTRHLTSVRIEVGTGRPTATVLGAPRHLPVRRPVTLGVALALAAAGLPTAVRHPAGRATRGEAS